MTESDHSPIDTFPTRYDDILARVEQVDAIAYGKTRNFLNGAVTRLSPYLTHGVLSTRMVMNLLRQRYTFDEMNRLIYELAWRDYFHRVWEEKGDGIFFDILSEQQGVSHHGIPAALLKEGGLGIEELDGAVRRLLASGYIHNHARMWLASVMCNIGHYHWRDPAAWLYYHLLDGDLASNTLGWQWVAGTFSHRRYMANQENLNKYGLFREEGTFLDTTYDELPTLPLPEVLKTAVPLSLSRSMLPTEHLPLKERGDAPLGSDSFTLFLYHPWSLDPTWHAHDEGERVVIFEPSHFEKHPMSKKRIEFILSLVRNIPGAKVYVGEARDIPSLNRYKRIVSKEYPATSHFPGEHEPREWLCPEVRGPLRAFTPYWKKCERVLYRAHLGFSQK